MKRSDNTAVLQQIPLLEFFRERIQAALAYQQLTASTMAEFYLANLLSEFKKTEKLFQNEGGKLQEETLSLLLAKAIESDLTTKIRILKRLGDISLYTAGFFKERVRNKKMVGLHYYVRMGGGAYHNLALMLDNDNTFSELYSELAQLFPRLVNVLTFISTQTGEKTNKDLIVLYEKWLATGDTSLEGILNKAGIPTVDVRVEK